MKKLKILILPVFIFAAILLLGSCAKKPHEYEWKIESYVKDGIGYKIESAESGLNHFAVCTSDAAAISFKDDGTFTFKDLAGTEYSGTYTSDKEDVSIGYKIYMTFEDGSTATANCASSGSSPYLRTEIDGINYFFVNGWTKNYTTADFNNDIKSIATAVRDASQADAPVFETRGIFYHKGIVEEKDGKFYLTYSERNVSISDGRTVYPYYIDEKDSLSYTSVKSGECIVREERGFGKTNLAIYYLSSNDSYIREEISFSDIYEWINDIKSVHDIEDITYVFDKGSIAPGHLQEARLANYAEREAIVNYLLNTKLVYNNDPESITEPQEGEPIDFVIITASGKAHKISLTNYHALNAYAYKPNAEFPEVADRGTNYVNIDTHLVHKEIFKNGEKVSNTDVDLSCIVLNKIDTYGGADLDFTTDCTYVSDVTLNVIDARHVQYENVLYEVVGEYDFSGCFTSSGSEAYSILTVKNSADGSVILTVKYDTGAVLDAEAIFNTALCNAAYNGAMLYTDAELAEDLDSLTLLSNAVIYVSLASQE